MKEYKRVFNVYSAWDYTREIEDLNKMSEKGWQLIKGGVFSNYYKKNDSIRYRYQLDFNAKIEDMGRYIETFHEQGWEYVNSTFNGWHYFRKLYDASVESDEYEIYNDSESLKEMHGKWQRMATTMLGILLAGLVLEIFATIRSFRLPSLILVILLLVETIVIGRGVYVLRNPQRADGHKRSWNGMPLFCGILFPALLAIFILIFVRGNNSFHTKSEIYSPISSSVLDGVDWGVAKIVYPDFYEFEVEGTAGAPITISIVNKANGEVVDQIRLDPSNAKGKKGFEEGHNIFLKRGEYTFYGSDFAGGALDLSARLD